MTYAQVTFTNVSAVRYKIEAPAIKFSATINANGGQISTSQMEVNVKYSVRVGAERGSMHEIMYVRLTFRRSLCANTFIKDSPQLRKTWLSK